MKTTFDNNTETYAELTNSIREVKQRLESAENALGSSNTNVANLLSDLAGLYDDLGDYVQASFLDQRCLAIREGLLGAEHIEVADALNDLAWEYRQMGDYERALPLFHRSLVITEKLLGQEHFDVATTLNSIADVYRLKGDYAQALPLCQRALEIRRKVLGQDHPDVTDSLFTLAGIYRGLGDCRKALTLCRQSIEIAESRLGPEDPLLAANLFLLGQIHEDLGDYDEALSTLRRALAIEEKMSGPDHPDVLESLRELAVVLGKQHEIEQSLSTSVELFKRQRRHFVGQMLALSDSDALRSIRSSFESVEFFNSVCAEGSAEHFSRAAVAGAEELALNKAFLEEIRSAQAAFETDPRTATKVLREQYQVVQIQLERLTQTKLQPELREARRRELQSELSQLEAKLAERVGLVAQMIRERDLKLNDVARNLPEQSALVDFIQYRRFNFAAKTNQWKEPGYVAYLTFPLAKHSTNVVVRCVDLGEAAPINEAVGLVRKRMSAGQFAARDLAGALARLSDLVYAPLAPYLDNASHLIICPEGQLSLVPFEMLPMSPQVDKLLVEAKTISYVSSGREIIRLAGRVSPQSIVRSPTSLVIGNPDFDFNLAAVQSSQAAPRSLSASFRGLKFTPLPNTAEEARSVAKLLGDDSCLRLGKDAREKTLKSVVSPRVLHLATHGFFLSDQQFMYTNSVRYGWQAGRVPYVEHDWENPLVRCGIALAGANHSLQITNAVAEDGLLTGLEASLLNLQGTELVILSACDSGSGDLQIGEGVMSLRRAFRIAGAESVLASHWQVSDKATTKLMTEFMRRWQSGESRIKAWREAQLELLRSKGVKDDYSNPYFWAAFTLTGQWR